MSKSALLDNTRSIIASTTAQGTHLALIALGLGAVAIGFAPIFVRLSEVGPSATGFWRLALALPVLWVWRGFEGRNATELRRPSHLADYARLALAGLCLAADLAIWHWSIHFTSVANATLLANFSPVFVALGAWLLFGQHFNLTFYGGMGIALIGAAILMGSGFSLGGQHLLGDMLGLLAALFYAGYMLTITRLRRDFSTATIMTWSGTVTCLVLLPVTLLSGETLLALSLGGWAVLLGLALITHVGGQGMITYALAHLPAPFSAVSLLLQPPVAALLAWLILQEPLSLSQGVGGLVILSGIILARLGSRPT